MKLEILGEMTNFAQFYLILSLDMKIVDHVTM